MVLDFKRKMLIQWPEGGNGNDETYTDETFTPDSVLAETEILQDAVITVTTEDAEAHGFPKAEGRLDVSLDADIMTNNLINAASDLGGRIFHISNSPATHEGSRACPMYRTEFRPKQGIHNLDFTTPAETPSEDEGGGK